MQETFTASTKGPIAISVIAIAAAVAAAAAAWPDAMVSVAAAVSTAAVALWGARGAMRPAQVRVTADGLELKPTGAGTALHLGWDRIHHVQSAAPLVGIKVFQVAEADPSMAGGTPELIYGPRLDVDGLLACIERIRPGTVER